MWTWFIITCNFAITTSSTLIRISLSLSLSLPIWSWVTCLLHWLLKSIFFCFLCTCNLAYLTPSCFLYLTHELQIDLSFLTCLFWHALWKFHIVALKICVTLMSFNTKRPGVSITRISVCRNSDVATRKKYANLVDSAKDSGGTVHIFSSLHVSGEREYYFAIPWFLLCLKPIEIAKRAELD